MEVTEVPFTDLLSTIIDNRGRTAPTADIGIPLIATNCIKEDGLYPAFENVRYIDEETYGSWFRGHPLPGDIIFVCKGAPGRVSLTPDPVTFCIAQDMVAVRPDVDRVYPRYLFAVLRSKLVRSRVNNLHVGTMIPHLKKGDFHNLLIPLVDDGNQRKIGDIYFELSYKIESNRRAIDLIQSLSRSTYAAWRSVGNDTRETTFGEFADVYGGATPKTTEPSFWDGDIAWATPTDITALTAPYLFRTARMITGAGLASTSATLHPEGTILMTSRATIGSFAVAHVPAATNQGFIAVRPRNPEQRWFLFEEMRARVPEMLDRANGSTFLELSRGNFKLMPVAVPDNAAIAELDSALAPLHAKAAQLNRESSRLATLRDALLPELLSGRIRVPDAVIGAIA